jgi:SET domain
VKWQSRLPTSLLVSAALGVCDITRHQASKFDSVQTVFLGQFLLITPILHTITSYTGLDLPQTNKCLCFPSLFPVPGHTAAPVQVGRCPRGRNNGLFARCGFERGIAVGEFTGLVTKGIEGRDVMIGGHGDDQYQIYQRRVGNYTRFINHSCAPNAQFTEFVWRGVERIIVVSKGIEPGMEVTVDYSPSYWTNLDKVCLCGELCCRYNRPDR